VVLDATVLLTNADVAFCRGPPIVYAGLGGAGRVTLILKMLLVSVVFVEGGHLAFTRTL
jgi:hypothetical protein